jgi:two-component sensor histidine kinase
MNQPADKADDRTVRLIEYQQALCGFSRVASETLPVDRLLHHAAAQVSRVTRIRHVKVLRYRPEKADLLIVAGVGWKPGIVGRTALPIDHASPPGRCFQTAAPVVLDDIAAGGEYRISPVLKEHGVVSLLNVPLRVDGRMWGVFEVDATTPRHFEDTDTLFLTTMANVLGMALQRMEAEQSLLDSLAESAQSGAQAEVLLRELQHRVKNNFQVIISFLALQRRHATSEDSHDRFGSVIDRIHAIALAHDQLSFQDSTGHVEFSDYLRALCANIDPRREGIGIEVGAGPGALPIDKAVPAGLIVNELVTNSFKYAFGADGGTIRVRFDVDADLGEACLEVSDDGRGIADTRPGGLGLTLVMAFVGQLAGRIERPPVSRGTLTRVFFPLAS